MYYLDICYDDDDDDNDKLIGKTEKELQAFKHKKEINNNYP
jgi:hypothetical protein